MLIPAIMSADIFNLAEELDKLLLLNIDALHVGVSTTLDQQPSLGFRVCRSIRNYSSKVAMDVCVRGQLTDDMIKSLIYLPVRSISIHVDRVPNWEALIGRIQQSGCAVGLAIPAESRIEAYTSYLEKIDRLLILPDSVSANGTTCSQQLIAVNQARTAIDSDDHSTEVVVVGAKEETIVDFVNAGGDSFVVGEDLFESEDYYEFLAKLRKKVMTAKNKVQNC